MASGYGWSELGLSAHAFTCSRLPTRGASAVTAPINTKRDFGAVVRSLQESIPEDIELAAVRGLSLQQANRCVTSRGLGAAVRGLMVARTQQSYVALG